MITIKLKTCSSKKNTTYQIVAVHPTSGMYDEILGFYEPIINIWSNKCVFINVDRLYYWLSRGAKLNNNVFVLIRPLLGSFSKKK